MERIDILLKRNHLTQRELAKMVGVSPATMSRILKGQTKPKFDMLLKIADILGTDVDSLITTAEGITVDQLIADLCVVRGKFPFIGPAVIFSADLEKDVMSIRIRDPEDEKRFYTFELDMRKRGPGTEFDATIVSEVKDV